MLRDAAASLSEGEPLTCTGYDEWRRSACPDAPGARSISEWFGGWAYALVEAGVPGTGLRPRRWTDDEMCEALARSGERTIGRYDAWAALQDGPRPGGAQIARRFGGWQKALDAVGTWSGP